MAEDLTKKAADMLLKGATLLSEPCPYCKGVRVISKGQALCISCGRTPEKKDIPKESTSESKNPIKESLEKKIESLSKELEHETNHDRQQEILKTINAILETMGKIQDKQ